MSLNFLNIDKFRKNAERKGCLVTGDIILDKYVYGKVNRISPEAPIPVVKIEKEQYSLGGAANVAGCICGYHVKTYLCGLLGEDENALKVKELLIEKGVEFHGVVSSRCCTTIKTRVVGKNQQLVRVDKEDNATLNMEEEEELFELLVSVLPKVQVVVLSDYNKGICSDSFCHRLMKICHREGKVVIVDPKSSNWSKYKGAYLIKPNFKEFQEAVGIALADTEASIAKYASSIFQRYGMNQILVTRSQYGMTLIRENTVPLTFESVQQEVFDVTGAGDTVVATISAFLAADMRLEDAIEVSNYAAGLAVSKIGTYIVTLEEVAEYISHFGLGYQNKIWDIAQMENRLQQWRRRKEKIVFTNGCFDIMHIGHIDYLNKARMMGSKLIVGLNTDASVKRLKGENRPVNAQEARASTLAALQCVDAVVMFDEDTPEELIRLVKPDYLVKGGDYKPEEIIGRQYADKVCTIPLVKGYSTTEILQKIQNDI